MYDDRAVFDLRPHQPEINLHKVRFDSASPVQSMVQYIEVKNAFREVGTSAYLVFVADNVLQIEAGSDGLTKLQINKADVCISTVYLESLSFIPCFRYTENATQSKIQSPSSEDLVNGTDTVVLPTAVSSADNSDVILFVSPNIHYQIANAGQFAPDYYGMTSDLIEHILSDEVFIDANDAMVFKVRTLQDLVGEHESKTLLHSPYYLLNVPDRQHLINLLDLSIKLRNVAFFVLTLTLLRRTSACLEFVFKDKNGTPKITGPWRHAIAYVVNDSRDAHYDAIIKRQFFDLNKHKTASLPDFIDVLCDNFTHFQRHINGGAEIVPLPVQKAFLETLITSTESFHFSAVGSGKTKVHRHLAKTDGMPKCVLIVLVPEHLLADGTLTSLVQWL
jgi:hypothetical protein